MEALFNDSKFSDVILKTNKNEYFLISALLKKHSLFFTRELAKLEFPEDINVSKNDEAAVILTTKKIISITDDLDEPSIEQVLKYMYGMKINLDNKITDVVMKFEITELVYDCCKVWSYGKFRARFLMAIETNSVLLPSLEKYLNEKITEIHDIYDILIKLPILYFVGLLSSPDLKCDEDFRYKIVNWYAEVNKVTNLMPFIKLTLLSKKILVHGAGKNPLVDKSDYYRALENLQCDIKESRKTDHVFFIGKHNQNYEGYKIVTDFVAVKSKFIEEYHKHSGIISIDDMNVNFLCTDKRILRIGNYLLGKNGHFVKKGEVVAFHTMNDTCAAVYAMLAMIELSTHSVVEYNYTHNVGLFMRDS